MDIASSVYEFYGGQYVNTESFSNIITIIENMLISLANNNTFPLLGFANGAKIELTFKKPTICPNQARAFFGPNYYGVLDLRVKYGHIDRRCQVKIPVVVGSSMCVTYGMSPTERYNIEESPFDDGGYIINNTGTEVILRIMERKQKTFITGVEVSNSTKSASANGILKTYQKYLELRNKDAKVTLSPVDRYYVACSFEDAYFQETKTVMYCVAGVYFLHISLPKRLPNHQNPAGVASLWGGAMYINLKEVLQILLPPADLSRVVSEALSNITDGYETEFTMIEESIRRTVSCATTTSEILHKSAAITESLKKNLNVQTLVDYIIPGAPNAESKVHTILYMTFLLTRSILTGNVSNTGFYANKYYVTQTDNIVRYLRDALLRALFNGSYPENDAITSSFRNKPVIPGRAKQEEDIAQPVEQGQMKRLLTLRLMFVPGHSRFISNDVRYVTPDQVGYTCIGYTPESEKVGLRKELGVLSIISFYRNHRQVTNYIANLINTRAPDIAMDDDDEILGVYVNSIYIDSMSRSEFYTMRNTFRRGPTTFDISFSEEQNSFRIYSSGGILGEIMLCVNKSSGHLHMYQGDANSLYTHIPHDFDVYSKRICDDLLSSKPRTTYTFRQFPKSMQNGDLCAVFVRENQFTASSIEKFYDTPTLLYMQILYHYTTLYNDEFASFILRFFEGEKLAPTVIDMFDTYVLGENVIPETDYTEILEHAYPDLVWREKYDYVRIHPAVMYGTAAGSVPFANHTYPVRVAYEANMCLQSMTGSPEQFSRKTPLAKISTTPMKCLCQTFIGNTVQKLWSGAPLVIAFCALPENNEDACYISDTAAQLFRYRAMRPMRICVNCSNDVREFAGIPAHARGISKYSGVDPNTGMPIVGTYIKPGDVVFAKYKLDIDGRTTIDTSERATDYAYGHIINIRSKGSIPMGKNQEISRSMKLDVIFMENLETTEGDKLHVRYSQKSTISKVIKWSKMPVVASGKNAGMRVEFIVSPAVLPSRQTVSYISEIVATTAHLETGKGVVDATPFQNRYGLRREDDDTNLTDERNINDLKQFYDEEPLVENVRMPNGTMAKLFIGVVHVVPLAHHSASKIVCGPKINPPPNKFRQPEKGKHQGGTRIGNQESLSFSAAGAMSMVTDRTRECADKIIVYACPKCGTVDGVKRDEVECSNCDGTLKRVTTCYSSRVFQQILAVAGMDIKMFPDE